MGAAGGKAFVMEGDTLVRFDDPMATEAVIPNGVRVIGLWAFRGCLRLRRVELPETVVEIGYEAFRGCEALEHINLPAGIRSIGDFAFSGCHSLKDLVIPPGLSLIGNRAFSNRKGRNLAEIPVDVAQGPGDLTPVAKLGDFLIHDGALLQYFGTQPHVAVPQGITAIKGQAFMGCATVRTVDIPDTVGYIHDHAFAGCRGLTAVHLPDRPISLGQGVFSDCQALTSINFFGWWSPGLFSGCTGLTALTLPPSVADISSNSLDGCANLARIDAPGAVEITRSWGFWPSSGAEVVGSRSTALVAPQVPPLQSPSLAIRINCALGYLLEPGLYPPAVAAVYESFLDTRREALLEEACRHGILALVEWYCRRRWVPAAAIGTLVDMAHQGGHPETAAALMAYRHDHFTARDMARKDMQDIARLLGE